MGSDHYVRPMSEKSIAREAKRCRDLSAAALPYDFNVANFIEYTMRERFWRRHFDIELFNRRSETEDPAYVTYNPLDLHVDKAVWWHAKNNDPSCRYILSHEVGHLCLHDNFDLSYSIGKGSQLEFAGDIHSAEWQANTFAHYFLLPDEIVDNISSEEALADACAVELQVARKRYHDRIICGDRSIISGGVRCKRCFRQEVYLTDNGARCFNCGSEAEFTPGLAYRRSPVTISDFSVQAELKGDHIELKHEAYGIQNKSCKMCGNFSLFWDKNYLKCSMCKHEEKIDRQYKLDI